MRAPKCAQMITLIIMTPHLTTKGSILSNASLILFSIVRDSCTKDQGIKGSRVNREQGATRPPTFKVASRSLMYDTKRLNHSFDLYLLKKEKQADGSSIE